MNDLLSLATRITAFEKILYESKAEELRWAKESGEMGGPVVDQVLNEALGVPLTLGPHQNKVIALLLFCVEQYDKLGLRAERDMLAEQIKKEVKKELLEKKEAQ